VKAALRTLALLVDPAAEWRWIERDPGDAAYLLVYYVAPLALIPALCGFVGGCLIGVIVPGGGVVRTPIFDGLFAAVFGYAAAFAAVLLIALLIAALAPRFGGRRDFTAAVKLAAFSLTPVWLAGIALILPGLHFLQLTGFYGAYLLVLGLPLIMKLPAQRAYAYAAAVVAFAGVLIFLIAAAQRALFATAGV
jgi:hypothetical protein